MPAVSPASADPAAFGARRFDFAVADLQSGGGMKVPVGKRLAWRFKPEGYATLTDAAVSVTCGPGCFVNFAADGWYQIAGTVGLATKF